MRDSNNILYNAYTLGEIFANYLKILSPKFDITNIGFLKIYFDSSYFYTTSDLKLLKEYINHIDETIIFFDDLFTFTNNDDYIFTLWPQEEIHYSFNIYKDFHYYNGCSFIKKNTDCFDIWWFVLNKPNDEANAWFLKNKIFLLQIIKNIQYKNYEHFQLIPNLNKLVYKNKCTFTNFNKKILECHNNEEIVKRFSNNYLNFKGIIQDNKLISIGKREFQCLFYFKKGYSAKEIAKKLNISHRTVESHLNNVKIKTELNYKGELLDLLEKQEYLFNVL